MPKWSTLSGFYEGSYFSFYEEEIWKCSLELQFDDTGRVNGSGYLTPGDDFAREPDPEDLSVPVVICGQITKKGKLYGVMVAPDRFDGVCWAINLDIEEEKKELIGEVMYYETTPDQAEPGSMELKFIVL